MDKKLKARWVKALRSGEFKQARETLTATGPKYCCLGVLARLMNPKVRRNRLDYPAYEILSKRQQIALAELNDGKKSGTKPIEPHSFDQIADYIERSL